MKTITNIEEDKYKRAKKKVNRIKGFYRHLTGYLSINIVITSVRLVHDMMDGVSFEASIWNLQTFFNWVPWGVAVLIHGIIALDMLSLFIGKNWEEKKIQEYIEKDKKDSTMNWE